LIETGELQMRPQTWLYIAVVISLITIGCKSSKHGDALYPKVELGMSFKDAKALIDGEGEERAYDNLPTSPKPREIYSKLPGNTGWHVWAAVGKPTLILGVVEGKIAFKQVLWTEDGERKSESTALPIYQ
jgi:hypothetical protein